MAVAPISATTIPDAGYNLTDSADFEAMVAGAGNGVQFDYNPKDIVVLKNGTGNPATFTFKVPQPAKYAAKSAVIADVDIVVADGKTWLYKLDAIFKDPANDKITVECDETADILVLRK